ncbi:MAG: hypothetical protein LBS36_07600 [Oscillospiraceae bacterium]|jgi:hypothetical protein|nr:hypothetical protein [Oscillospiraceae bacterium]
MKDLHSLDKYRQPDIEKRLYGGMGNSGNGCFKVMDGLFSLSPPMAEDGSTSV